MSTLNKAMIIGNVGDDPTLRYLPSGEAVTTISLATSERWKDKASGENREQTEWHRCTFFGRMAEVVGEYVRKGAKLYVEGKIQTKKWQDKEGQDRYTTEIRADRMQMLDKRGASSDVEDEDQSRQHTNRGNRAAPAAAAARPPAAARPSSSFDDMDSDIPF